MPRHHKAEADKPTDAEIEEMLEELQAPQFPPGQLARRPGGPRVPGTARKPSLDDYDRR